MGGWWARPCSAAPPTTAAVLRPKVIGPYRATAFEVCDGRVKGLAPERGADGSRTRPVDGIPRSTHQERFGTT